LNHVYSKEVRVYSMLYTCVYSKEVRVVAFLYIRSACSTMHYAGGCLVRIVAQICSRVDKHWSIDFFHCLASQIAAVAAA
jgi:Uri superfamily endonuclease